MFKKILIANRGEIAVRIARAAREMNIETVAVYHDIDKEMPFVHYSDFAYRLEGESPRSVYLDKEQIIAIALKANAEAIHPGYGFLSENADFAEDCERNGIIFIGPSSESIRMMGSKTKAREIMAAAGVPIVPGNKEPIDNVQNAKRIASEIGYPVLIKASAGGGGKGMKKVFSGEDLEESFLSAKREALKAFKDDSVYIEKYIERPKHIEFQIIADNFNNIVHLGERDCSIQRRHQKVIEECPSSVLDESLREEMGQVAIAAGRACGYKNAGTIEFLLSERQYYFLEMNTRLQVEHPVTEMVYGLDLVKEQIRIAAGEKLSFSQENVRISGHAIECRIYAEDAFNEFLPETGKITYFRQPGGYGVRLDSGVEQESEISVHFDPMIAKLITWGRDRNDAISRMERALYNFKIKGVVTIIPFLLSVLRHPEFKYGFFDTGFIEHAYDMQSLQKMRAEYEELVAAIASYGLKMTALNKKPQKQEQTVSKWKEKHLLLRRLI